MPATPLAVFRPVAAQPRDVVAAVVVNDEHPPARSEDTLGLCELGGADAAEARPLGDYGICLSVGQWPGARAVLPEGLVCKEAAFGMSETFRVSSEIEYDHSGKYAAIAPFDYSGP